MISSSRTAGYVALVAVCILWGTTYLGIRMAIESFPPAILVSLRYLISGGVLVLGARLCGSPLPRGSELVRTALSGILVIGVGNGALAFAEESVPSGLASLIVTTSPFWFLIFEAMLPGGVALHWPTLGGMLVGFAGTVLLFLPGARSNGLGPGLLGGFAILQVGILGWCLGSIYQKRQPARAHPIVTGAVQQLASALAFIPVALLVPHAPIVIKPRAAWAVVYLVVFGSILGYSAYAYALARLPVAIFSVYSYVNSVVAVCLGWAFYREPFGPRELVAMIVIFTGVAIVKWQSARSERTERAA